MFKVINIVFFYKNKFYFNKLQNSMIRHFNVKYV